jgi:hypothetical protein
MFTRKSQGQKPADGIAGPGPTPAARGGRHALGAPRSEAPQEPATRHVPADHADPDDAHRRIVTGRMVRFPDLQVAVKDGTVYDTTGRPRAVGQLSGARAHVNVLEPDPRKTGVLSRAVGRSAVSMVIPIEITVTVSGDVLARSRNATTAATRLIRDVKTQAAEFNDLARHWPG